MRWRAQADLLAALALVLVAAVAALALGPGPLRVLLTLPALAVAPGYLLVQAAVPRQRPSAWLRHACAALGAGPALLGLCALATALVPGGFRPVPIVLATTAAAALLGAVALLRRRSAGTEVEPAPAPERSAKAA
jgi:uncharacterized membrane protein